MDRETRLHRAARWAGIHLLADGTVRVRFQENAEGRNYDPSIADVWSLPATTG